jgi:hypothetical protein
MAMARTQANTGRLMKNWGMEPGLFRKQDQSRGALLVQGCTFTGTPG